MLEIFGAAKFRGFAFSPQNDFPRYTLKTVNRYIIAISIQSLLKNVGHIMHYFFKCFFKAEI